MLLALIKAHLYAALVTPLDSLLFGIEFHARLTIDLASEDTFFSKLELPKKFDEVTFVNTRSKKPLNNENKISEKEYELY